MVMPLPEGACASFRALYYGLEDLEKDLHRHIHLENNVLFPKAIEIEADIFVKDRESPWRKTMSAIGRLVLT